VATHRKIVLVRHGLSAHVHAGLVDLAGLQRWRAAYEAAGIDERHEPPPPLRSLARTSGAIAASTSPRAVHSAQFLAPGRDVMSSPLLVELGLAPPNFRGVRMPLRLWGLAVGLQWLLRMILRRPVATDAELQRSDDAASWLIGLAENHGSVVAVTHGSFRMILAERLEESGWRCESRTSRMAHWSAWSFSQRPDATI
jgi:hypothetical protein